MTKYENAIAKMLQRYPVINRETTTPLVPFQKQWDQIETFFSNRPAYAIPYMKNYIGLQGELATVTLQVKDNQGGKIRLNTFTPSLSAEGIWSGSYLTDCPVTVTAIPEEGWTFAGWECEQGNIADTTLVKTTVLPGPQETVVTARFVKTKENIEK